MGEWQPIETAPRDGSRFLACVRVKDRWQVIIAGVAKNGILFDENGDSTIEWDPCGKNGRLAKHRPLWMPLPSPPTTREPG